MPVLQAAAIAGGVPQSDIDDRRGTARGKTRGALGDLQDQTSVVLSFMRQSSF